MDFIKVGSRGYLFTWMEPYRTNVYVIIGEKQVFVIDTFLGNEPMEELNNKLDEEGIQCKSYVVFNTHADYDHYWGNRAFSESLIISHEQVLRRINSQGKEPLIKFQEYMKGEVKITPPNLTFRKHIVFTREGVEFFHTPGHTGDSSSCFDRVDRVLLPGDNLEAPYPYVNLLNLKDYVQSLEEYDKLDMRFIIPGHDPLQTNKKLLKKNLDYIKAVAVNQVNIESMNKRELSAHLPNLNRLAELYGEKGDKIKSSDYFRQTLAVIDLLDHSIENNKLKEQISLKLAAIR